MDTYGGLLSSDVLPTFQYFVPPGMQGMQGAQRDSGSAEDAPAFVKTSLARLLDRQNTVLHRTWEAGGYQVAPGSVPRLFQPFARLISSLLPHLEFMGVDDKDPNSIQVNFRAAGSAGPVFDIDYLSSGEKAAIALLLPLVERQAEQLITRPVTAAGVVPLTMLLDEPEIHLHPLLQLQVLQYLRDLAAEDAAQFILTTHSTTLLDALADDELYLMSPAALSPDNQLSRLTTSRERLELARELTGSTHLLTRAKLIVFLEGVAERAKVSSDVRLVTNLLPQTKSWALVPGRSKSEVITAVTRLRQDGLELPGTPVFGLVDADTDSAPRSEHVVVWPVAMVENFLLDAEAIFEVLQLYGAQATASSVDHVRDVLDRVALAQVDDEIRLRVQRQLPHERLTLRPDQVENAADVAKQVTDAWLARVQELDVAALKEAARTEVEAILAEGTHLDRFHGKRLLEAVFQALQVQRIGVGKAPFAVQLSANGAARTRAARLAEPALQRIRLFFPAGLEECIRQCGAGPSTSESLAQRCRRHYELWSTRNPESEGRLALREEIFAFARTSSVEEHQRRELVELASQIGTP